MSALWIFQGLWLQDDVALRRCNFHSQEVGDVRDRQDDLILLSGSTNGSFTIVRASLHGECLTFDYVRLSICCVLVLPNLFRVDLSAANGLV